MTRHPRGARVKITTSRDPVAIPAVGGIPEVAGIPFQAGRGRPTREAMLCILVSHSPYRVALHAPSGFSVKALVEMWRLVALVVAADPSRLLGAFGLCLGRHRTAVVLYSHKLRQEEAEQWLCVNGWSDLAGPAFCLQALDVKASVIGKHFPAATRVRREGLVHLGKPRRNAG